MFNKGRKKSDRKVHGDCCHLKFSPRTFFFNSFSCRCVPVFLLVSHTGSFLPCRWLQWLMVTKIPSCLSFLSHNPQLLSTYYVSGTVPGTCHTSGTKIRHPECIIPSHLSTKTISILNRVQTTTAGTNNPKIPVGEYREIIVLSTSRCEAVPV